jgi:hypothetical protein
MSFNISLTAFFCAEVSSKGRLDMNLLTKPSCFISSATVLYVLAVMFLIMSIFSSSKKSSSYTSVYLAFDNWASLSGK